jgi:hypothetical protein
MHYAIGNKTKENKMIIKAGIQTKAAKTAWIQFIAI